ncbi:MAG: histone deacetylase [Thermoprotei archaeon]|nr:MAG: histone deacetylase [Thermoprotei archaeon]
MGVATGVVYSREFLKHDTGEGHPESWRRLLAAVKAVKGSSLTRSVKLVRPEPIALHRLLYVHALSLVERVKRACDEGQPIDSDTVVSRDSFNVALLAAGGAVKAGELVAKGELSNAFCLIRPPGHHATRTEAMGFCLFNNAAVLAAYLLREVGARRVLIVDWDVHHGNGTQEIFYEDPSVLYFSVHQDGRTIYPGTGHFDEVGAGEGEGFNVNLPLPPGVGDDVYLEALRELLPPIADGFKPDFVVASVGFDAHYADQLGNLKLSVRGYYEVAKLVAELAREHCSGRLVAVLEGGYHLKYMPRCFVNTLAAFMGRPPIYASPSTSTDEATQSYVEGLLGRIKRLLSRYWAL